MSGVEIASTTQTQTYKHAVSVGLSLPKRIGNRIDVASSPRSGWLIGTARFHMVMSAINLHPYLAMDVVMCVNYARLQLLLLPEGAVHHAWIKLGSFTLLSVPYVT
jgi:hypothetical protein